MAWSGALARSDLTAQQLKFSRAAKAVFLKPSNHPLLSILTDRAAKDPVTDIEYDVFTRPYPVKEGMLWGYNAGSKAALTQTATSLYIASAANFLRVGDIIKIPGTQSNIGTAGYKTILGELVKVTGTPNTNEATVQRNIGGGTAVDCAGTGAADGLNWRFAGEAEPVGGGTRTAKGAVKGDRRNYIQSFCEPFSMASIMRALDFWPEGGKGEERDMRDDALTLITDAVEMMLLYGQRDKGTDALGRNVYMSGGAQYWLNQTDTEEDIAAWTEGASGTDLVLGDGTSRIWRALDTFNKLTVGKFMTRAFRHGNPTKWGIHGERFMPIWDNLWEDSIQRTQQLTDYGVTVNSHTVQGKKINFVYCPVMDKEDPTGLFLLDIPYMSVAVLNDIHPRKPAHDPETEVGSRTYDWDFIADLGCKIQFLKSHAYIKDINDIV
jgi:hypothetical protein